jgi:hypothetical protein
MKKIIIDKTDDIAEVIDAMLNEPDSEIALVIPNGSVLGKSMRNFHLLKREAEAAEKTVAIESVDETILAFAKESHIEASHPLWRGVRGSSNGVSDIVPKSGVVSKSKKKIPPAIVPDESKEDEEGEDKDDDKESGNEAQDTSSEERLEEEEVREEQREARSPFFARLPRRRERLDDDNDGDDVREEAKDGSSDDDNGEDNGPRRGGSGKLITGILIAIIVLLGGAYIASAFFNHATITIDFKKTPWSDQLNLTADKAASADNISNNTIVAQIFTPNTNLTQLFPGSLVQQVSQKAQGSITIYNDYSAAPQKLLVNTRFLTPDGKIFHITQAVTVPGATMAGSTLTPSSIVVPIVADQAGPDYNIGPVAKLSIPGFAGTPQANGFYGAITASTTGGFVGQRATPTAADIATAKASTTALLQTALQGELSGSYTNNFKVLPGATQIQVTKLTVNTSTDANGNFSVFGEATLQAIGFDETALKNDLLAQAQSEEASSVFSDITLNYSNIVADFTNGRVAFAVSAQADLEPQLTVASLQGSVLGKSITDTRSAISQLPQLDNAEISIWPSWLWTIPSDPNKVHITIN